MIKIITCFSKVYLFVLDQRYNKFPIILKYFSLMLKRVSLFHYHYFIIYS